MSHKLITRSKILCVVSQEALHKIQVVQATSGIYKWCHSNNQVMSIKNARFKPQPSTPNAYLCINKKLTFLWKLMTKGERLYKDMKAWLNGGEIVQWERWDIKEIEVGHEHGQRGSNIGEKRWIKILGQEKHTSRGSKLMNFDWLHLICAYSCACLHCISF